jgi:polyribonucleotide nucleotidyltransferase
VALQLSLSDLNLVYACIKDKTLMIDVEAREISDKDLQAGLRFAHTEVTFIVITCLTLFIIECY